MGRILFGDGSTLYFMMILNEECAESGVEIAEQVSDSALVRWWICFTLQ